MESFKIEIAQSVLDDLKTGSNKHVGQNYQSTES